MRRIVICTGILGGGSAIVFTLAALTATLFPHGTLVPAQLGGLGGWGAGLTPMPAVMVEEVAPGGWPVPAPVNDVDVEWEAP